MKPTRFFAAILLALTCVMGLAACGGHTEPTGENTEEYEEPAERPGREEEKDKRAPGRNGREHKRPSPLPYRFPAGLPKPPKRPIRPVPYPVEPTL